MKKLLILILAICLMTVPLAALAETAVTSFYPIWIFALNLTEGIDGIDVVNLAAPDTGCLHDYQLQTGDMKALAKADLFLVNGAGMESYLDVVKKDFPDLPVTVASEGIEFLAGQDAMEIGEKEEEEGVNSHIWLDAANAAIMTANLAEGLRTAFPQYADQITANETVYMEKLTALDTELREKLSGLPKNGIVTFHEAFPYFAKAYGLDVLAVVNKEPGETLTPKQMAELTDAVKALGLPPLFTEPQYEDLSARMLAQETGAKVYCLDPVVTGPEEDVPLDLYEQTMRQNAETLLEALQ